MLAAARDVPEAARAARALLADQLRDLRGRIDTVTERIKAAQADDSLARRLATVLGIGAISASALAATTPDVGAFRAARDYAAWAHAQTAFKRRQGTARADLQGR